MKKFFISAVLALGMCISNVYSQERIVALDSFFDNWYGGVMAGTIHSPYNKGMKPAFGLEIGKQITPVLAASVQGITGINSTYSNNAFDDLNITLNGKLNLMNLFLGYKGEPRLFEVEGVFGIGLMHEFFPSAQRAKDNNALSARAGASLNFNLGKEKRWTLSVRPAYLGVVDGKAEAMFENASRFELMAGVVYSFGRHKGKPHMEVREVYGQDYIDTMNDDINDMRRRMQAMEKDMEEKDKKNEELMAALSECNAKAKQTEESMPDSFIEPVVSFRKSSADLEVTQLPNLENMVTYMEKYPELKLELKGYASPEGNAKFNQKLSERRANRVKEILVNKYGIDADRITATGMGIGENFSEPEMNRAVIATFKK